MDSLQMGFTSGGGCDNAVFFARTVVDYFAINMGVMYMSIL